MSLIKFLIELPLEFLIPAVLIIAGVLAVIGFALWTVIEFAQMLFA